MRKELNEKRNKLKSYFKEKDEVIFAFLFGSMATGKSTKLSDTDIAFFIDQERIEKSRYRYGYKSEIISELQSLLGTNKIDIAIIDNAPLLLKYKIGKDGELIFTRDKKKLYHYRIKLMEQYLDSKVAKVK